MEVFITTLIGNNKCVSVSANADLAELRQKVASEFAWPPDCLVLLLNGRALPCDRISSSRPLSSFCIENYTSVMAFRQKGPDFSPQERAVIEAAESGSGKLALQYLKDLEARIDNNGGLNGDTPYECKWYSGTTRKGIGCLAGFAVNAALKKGHYEVARLILGHCKDSAVTAGPEQNLPGPFSDILASVPEDMLAAALKQGMAVTELLLYEAAYCPPILSTLLFALPSKKRWTVVRGLASQPEFRLWGKTHDGQTFEEYCQGCLQRLGWEKERVLWAAVLPTRPLSKEIRCAMSILSPSIMRRIILFACPLCLDQHEEKEREAAAIAAAARERLSPLSVATTATESLSPYEELHPACQTISEEKCMGFPSPSSVSRSSSSSVNDDSYSTSSFKPGIKNIVPVDSDRSRKLGQIRMIMMDNLARVGAPQIVGLSPRASDSPSLLALKELEARVRSRLNREKKQEDSSNCETPNPSREYTAPTSPTSNLCLPLS